MGFQISRQYETIQVDDLRCDERQAEIAASAIYQRRIAGALRTASLFGQWFQIKHSEFIHILYSTLMQADGMV